MTSFLNQVRETQAQQLKKRKTPQQVYKELNQNELQKSLNGIKNQVKQEAIKHPESKTLKAIVPLIGGYAQAIIDAAGDTKTEEYFINRNLLGGDWTYPDYSTQQPTTWLCTQPLYQIDEDLGMFGNKVKILLTKRGKAYFDELKNLCAAEGIAVKFYVHASWKSANPMYSDDVFVEYNKEFKAKAKLTNVYPAVEFVVKL